MTALILGLAEQEVIIATDTLAVDPDQKRPWKFMTKAYLLPHLGGAMCGTGIADVIVGWFHDIQQSVIALLVRHLNDVAPQLLRRIWTRLNIPKGLTSTIYHVGYAKDENRFIGFALRSEHGFDPQPLAYNIYVKPNHGDVVSTVESLTKQHGALPIMEIMMELQRRDRQLPVAEQVGVGGEVVLVRMTSAGYIVQTQSFPDSLQVSQEIWNRHGLR